MGLEASLEPQREHASKFTLEPGSDRPRQISFVSSSPYTNFSFDGVDASGNIASQATRRHLTA